MCHYKTIETLSMRPITCNTNNLIIQNNNNKETREIVKTTPKKRQIGKQMKSFTQFVGKIQYENSLLFI